MQPHLINGQSGSGNMRHAMPPPIRDPSIQRACPYRKGAEMIEAQMIGVRRNAVRFPQTDERRAAGLLRSSNNLVKYDGQIRLPTLRAGIIIAKFRMYVLGAIRQRRLDPLDT
jgi:hypothetical protein